METRMGGGEPRQLSHVATDLLEFLKLIADDTRFRIVHMLLEHDELNVRALCHMLGQNQPAVSHHLALLRVAGLIDRRKEGKHNFYFLLTDKLDEVASTVRSIWPDARARIQRDGACQTVAGERLGGLD